MNMIVPLHVNEGGKRPVGDGVSRIKQGVDGGVSGLQFLFKVDQFSCK